MNSLSSKHPLLILKDLEEEFSTSLTQQNSVSDEDTYWSGLGVKIGSFDCVIENRVIAEICLPNILENLSKVPGTKSWFLGLVSLRGQALPIVDMQNFLFTQASEITQDSRVLVLKLSDFTTGILISRTLGLVRTKNEMHDDAGIMKANEFPYVRHHIKQNEKSWPVIDITELENNSDFRNMAG